MKVTRGPLKSLRRESFTPENVAEAVKFCKPYGVDVNSGCRAEDGSRDAKKVEAFVKFANVKID